MAEYEDSKTVLIADVDCTDAGKDMCEEVGVQGFPTIKYGDPNALEDYEGGRALKDLQKFAKESLGPRCGPANPELCEADQKKRLDDLMAMSEDDLETLLKSLQEQYEEAQKKNEETKKSIKEA